MSIVIKRFSNDMLFNILTQTIQGFYPAAYFRCVEISAGGGLIVAAGSADDTAHVWRLPAGEVLQKLVCAQARTDNGAAAESVLNTVADLDMEHIILKGRHGNRWQIGKQDIGLLCTFLIVDENSSVVTLILKKNI